MLLTFDPRIVDMHTLPYIPIPERSVVTRD